MANSRLCSVEGCGKPFLALGCCKSHYNRLKLYGDPNGGMPVRGSGLQWLFEHASHTGDECLIWPFARVSAGYGNVSVGNLEVGAHRLMCMLKHGQPPTPKHEAAHNCGRGKDGCVNPNHLRWATRIENRDDMVEHGTAPRGENCGRAVLTEADILEIRRLAGTMTQKEIGERFNVGAQAVGKILNGHRWSHVPGDDPSTSA